MMPAGPGFRSLLSLAGITVALFVGKNTNADELDTYLFSSLDTGARSFQSTMVEVPSESWLSDPELRIAPERDDFDRTSQTYSFRFRPTGSKERNAIERISRIDDRLASTRWDMSLSGALATRYHRVIDLAWQEVSAALVEQQLLIGRSVFGSERMMSATTEFDAGRMQSAALQLELLEQEARYETLKTGGLRAATVADYLVVSKHSHPLVSDRLISPLMIASWLDEFISAPIAESFRIRLAQLQVDQADQQATLQRSRSGFGLDLMELSYEDKVSDSYNVTFGFRLPFGQGENTSYRRSRALAAARQEAWLVEQSTEDEVRFTVQEMRWQIAAYSASIDALQELEQQSRSAATIAEVRKHELKLLESAGRKHIQLLHDFVDLLQLTGQLRQPDNKNWIRRNIQ